jgi:hypothetical protein
MSKYTVTAPKTPGAQPAEVAAVRTLAEARRAARPFASRPDLKGQDVRINRADGSLVEYAGPSR